jgi:hypothetical protein
LRSSQLMPPTPATALFPRQGRHAPARGIALISTLAIVSIITVLLVSFVSVVNQDRGATQNYGQALRADQIARGGLDSIVGLLTQEASDPKLNDFTNAPGTSYQMYGVTNQALRTNLLPQRAGGTSFPTIVSYSGTDIYKSGATEVLITNAGISTATNSLNGRAISVARWNKPQLVESTNGFPVPSWILVTRQGVALPNLAVMTNSSLGNNSYVIGRFAYVVYDTSGLIDINVAGNPSPTPTAAAPNPTGLLPWADLTQLGISATDVGNLLAWRNPVAGTNTATYAAYITNCWATNGFMTVTNQDNAFLGRQDLINYAASTKSAGLSNALPYLTTFSREVNGPTWGPEINATGASYQYFNNQFTLNSTNPAIYKARVKTGFTRNSGMVAVADEPLVKYRFPLRKLALFDTTAAPNPNAAEIAKYFGLDPGVDPKSKAADSTAAYHHWAYPTADGKHSAGVILTLDQVAANGREPDFFELLKAGIYAGSLGLEGRGDVFIDNTLIGTSHFLRPDPDTNADGQIIQIGVNIIDQWDADDYPTTITFTMNSAQGGAYPIDFYGVENIPYIEQIFTNFDTSNYPVSMVGNLYFSLWNPHQPKIAGSSSTSITVGAAILAPLGASAPAGFGYDTFGYALGMSSTSANHFYSDEWGWYDAAHTSINPTAIYTPDGLGAHTPSVEKAPFYSFSYDPSSSSAPYRSNALQKIGTPVLPTPPPPSPDVVLTSYKGIPALRFKYNYPPIIGKIESRTTFKPDFTQDPPPADLALPMSPTSWTSYLNLGMVSFAMQFQDPTTSLWHPYGFFAGYAAGYGGSTYLYYGGMNYEFYANHTQPNGAPTYLVEMTPTPAATVGMDRNFVKADPRMRRWSGYFATGGNAAAGLTSANATIPDAFLPAGASFGMVKPPDTGTMPYDVIQYWQSNTNTPTSTTPGYTSLDGIQRPGDSAGLPQNNLVKPATAAVPGDAHPVVLNRPFASVGDLGYVFRDEPWKTLDFASPQSADAGLLDLFTLEDGPILAGRVSPNTPYPQVIQALLAGGAYAPGFTPMSGSDAQTLAPQIVKALSNNPAANRAELVTHLMTNSVFSGTIGTGAGAGAKAQREAVIRAMAEVANTRTWNFMIDVIAQTGRYPTTAKTPNDFVVTGERRYWLHVAIDRYTGQVIDQQLEKVGE